MISIFSVSKPAGAESLKKVKVSMQEKCNIAV
jgi:hypothetical protein